MAKREELKNRVAEAEVIVIGGGITGLLTAYFLQQAGKQVLVLEADEAASGQTGRTTAKITSQHGLFYDKLIKNVGEDVARLYAHAHEDAIGAYEKLVKEQKIDCDFKRLPAYLYSVENAEGLRREVKAAERLGLPAKFVHQVNLPFKTVGAVCFENQAQFHPLKFVEAIAKKLEIREHTPVRNVKGNEIFTDKGVFWAKKIIFATHYPIVDFPGLYFLRQHQERSYVLAVTDCPELDGMYYGADEGGLSLRSLGDVLLIGGGGHRTGKNKTGGAYEALRRAAERYFPGSREVGHWSAQDCVPHDGIPFIGQYFYGCRDWYVATGYQKWGMTSAMVAARLLTDMLTGVKNPYEAVFTPGRHHVKAAFPNLMKDVGESICGLTAGWIPGLGQKVESGDGKSVKVPRCAHLGCKLTWNPDEESWDCPCHGSRYDKNGKLLDEPARRNLPPFWKK